MVGSKDMNTRVFAVQPCENLVVHSMGGHTDAVVGAFFEHNCMDVSFATAHHFYFLLHCPTGFCVLSKTDFSPVMIVHASWSRVDSTSQMLLWQQW